MTKFFLATKPGHFSLCHNLLHRLGRKAAVRFTTPTVIARRDGKFVGFAATGNPEDTDNVVMLAEMAVDPDIQNNQHLIFRLLDTYNSVMAYAGIETYYSCVSKTPPFEAQIEAGKRLFTVQDEDDDFVWFKHTARKEAA